MTTSKYINRVEGHALVLGGSGDIGREVVLALAANGASALSFTYGGNKAAADQLAKDLQDAGHRNIYYAQLSIPKTDSEVLALEKFMEDAVNAAGEEITAAVNTIGKSPNQPYWDQKIEGSDGWREVYETNVFGAFLSARAIAKRMKGMGIPGSIVQITSTNGVNSQAEFSVHYDTSKAAQAHEVRTTAEVLAREFGIRYNGVAPGWVRTKMNASVPPEEMAAEEKKIWLGRQAKPSEIAKVIAFVAGTGGSYIVGQNIMVDGGYR